MADLPVSEEPAAEAAEAVAEEKPKARRRPRARKAVEEAAEAQAAPAAQAVEVALAAKEAVELPAEGQDEEKPVPSKAEGPKRRTRAKKKPDDAPVEPKPAPKAAPEASNEDVPGEPRRGWWQRTFG